LRFDERVVFGHTGSMPGFLAVLMSSKEDGLTVAAQSNAWSELATRGLVGDLLTIVREKEPTWPVPWKPAEHVDRAAFELAGPWYWGADPVAVSLQGDGLLKISGLGRGGRTARFEPVGDGRWRGLDGYYHGEFLEPKPNPDGVVTHLDIGSFVLTRAPYSPGEIVPNGLDTGDWQL
jgi:hypothetical protein